MKKTNDYGLPLKLMKSQIYQSGKLKGRIKYGLMSRICDAQLECIKDHKVAIDHILEISEFILKQNQQIWKERNDAVRAYNGLVQLKKSAEQLGIDTNAMPTPEQKEFMEKYQFVQKITVTENGKTFYRYQITPKKKKQD
jgi:hypothetical protein